MSTATTSPVSEVLREWRGDMKLDRAAVYLSDRLGREVSRETVRRYEVGQVPLEKMDGSILAGLARVYGHSPDDLPEEGREIAHKVRQLFDLTDDPNTPGGLANPPSLCNADRPAQIIPLPLAPTGVAA